MLTKTGRIEIRCWYHDRVVVDDSGGDDRSWHAPARISTDVESVGTAERRNSRCSPCMYQCIGISSACHMHDARKAGHIIVVLVIHALSDAFELVALQRCRNKRRWEARLMELASVERWRLSAATLGTRS